MSFVPLVCGQDVFSNACMSLACPDHQDAHDLLKFSNACCRWNDVLLAPYGATNPTAFYNQAFTTLSGWTLQRLAWLDQAFAAVSAAGNQIVLYPSSPQNVATAG